MEWKWSIADDGTALCMTLNSCLQSCLGILWGLQRKQTKARNRRTKMLCPNHLQFKLITLDIPPPQWLPIVSLCNCSKTFSFYCKLWDSKSRSLLTHCDTLAGAENAGSFTSEPRISFRASTRRASDGSVKASAWLEFGHGNEMEHIKCQQEACSSCQEIF